jgi:5-(carboxyamino)imidazole ribonucleotide mutase
MAKILVLFASKSDKETYNPIIKILKKNKLDFDLKIYSAHKTPDEVEKAIQGDYSLIITGAGLAAALPGVVAAKFLKPVIGVPCHGSYEGLDALLSIVQMPPGIPVLSVGVNKAEIAASNAVKMLKNYEVITIIGDQGHKAVSKAADILKKFEIPHKFSTSPNVNTINLEFVYFDEPVEKKDELIIYCPLLLDKDDKAEAALNLLKHSNHGLWVGLNNGVNAAVAAVEIMNINNKYEQKLINYRKELGKKVIEANK